MTNKLVVIINSFEVPKIKKILLYEIKFLVPNYSCLRSPQILVLPVLCPQLNLLNLPTNKIPGYATLKNNSIIRYKWFEYFKNRQTGNCFKFNYTPSPRHKDLFAQKPQGLFTRRQMKTTDT